MYHSNGIQGLFDIFLLTAVRACLVKNESAANAPIRPHFSIIFVK